jgi:CRP-like cAMP-binding protein
MYSQLIRKLERFCPLTQADKDSLLGTIRRPLRNVSRGEQVVAQGEIAHDVRVLLSGWAVRCKQVKDGRRQILSIVLPADVCDLNVHAATEMDHAIVAATPLVLGELPRAGVQDLMVTHPALHRALSCDMQQSIGLLHEAIVNIGQRNALERMANLFCELSVRLELIGANETLSFPLPLTQADLAAATGLSTVHVNRTLQELRRMGLIALSGKDLRVLDLHRLKSLAMFDPAFLHVPESHDNNGPVGAGSGQSPPTTLSDVPQASDAAPA